MKPVALRPRVMVADFDSVTQGAVLLGAPAAERPEQRLTAALRFVVALGADVAITTPQLLDGAWFLMLGPAGVRQVLGWDADRPLPLGLSCHVSDPESWLRDRLARPTFVWSSAPALEERGWGPDDVRTAREDWLRAIRMGQLGRVELHGDGPGLIAGQLKDWPAPAGQDPDAIARLRALRDRSAVVQELAGRADGPALLAWWQRPYHQGIADQHRASWLELPPAASRQPPSGEARRHEPASRELGKEMDGAVRVDGDLLERFGTLTAWQYAGVVSASAGARHAWEAGRHRNAMRTLAMATAEASTSQRTWLGEGMRRLVWAAVLLLLAGLSGLSLMFPESGWLLAVPLVAMLVTEVPWVELYALFQLRPGHLDAIMHLEPGRKEEQ